jgi:hypothetical protein
LDGGFFELGREREKNEKGEKSKIYLEQTRVFQAGDLKIALHIISME